MPNKDNDNENDYETHSFILLGKTGVGKSSLCNNICKENKFVVGDSFDSCTTQTSSQIIVNNDKKYKLLIIDTPGFEDTEGRDNENIEKMKNFIKENERIKGIIIVIDFRNVRFDLSLQNSIKIIADLFPLNNFWEHVIIVWSHFENNNIAQKQKIESKAFFNSKSLQNVFDDLEKNNKISKPTSLKMKFIDSNPNLTGEELKISQESAEDLVKDIINMKPMYKNIIDMPEKEVIDNTKQEVKQGDDTIIYYKKIKKRIFVDFDDKKTEKEYITEKFSITKKEEESEKKEVSLSPAEVNKRNKIIKEEREKYKDEESDKRTKRENIKKYVIYKIYKFYKDGSATPDKSKTEETTNIKKEWTEEDVTETQMVCHGISEYTYYVYKYKEIRTNNYNDSKINDKKIIDTYYEKKEKQIEYEGKFNSDGTGIIYRNIKEVCKDRYNKNKGQPKLINKYRIERIKDIKIIESSIQNDGKYKFEEILKENDEEKGKGFIELYTQRREGICSSDFDYRKDIFDYSDNGQDGEYTDYYHDEKREVFKINGKIVKYKDWKNDGYYEIRARYEIKDRKIKDINETDVEESFKRRLNKYNTKTKLTDFGVWETITNKETNYYKIDYEYKDETDIQYEDTNEKDADSKIIKKKHLIYRTLRKKIKKRYGSIINTSNWEKYNEKERKNIKCEMIYRKKSTGRFKYKSFMWAKWDHEYEYDFYKQIKRYYNDNTIEYDDEIYRGSWYIYEENNYY